MALTAEKCCRCKEYHLRVRPCSDGQPWHSKEPFRPDGPVPPGKSEVRSNSGVVAGSPASAKQLQVTVKEYADAPTMPAKSRQQRWKQRHREWYNEYMRRYRAKRKGS